MNKKYLDKLEFNKIINMLKNFCYTDFAKELFDTLLPFNSYEKVSYALEQTNQSQIFLNKLGKDLEFTLPNTTYTLKKLESKTCLTLKELLEFGNILKNSRSLKETFFENDLIDISSYPLLEDLFSMLYTNISVENNILSKVLDENTLDDHSSSALYSIRCKKRKLESDIKDKLNIMIHSSSFSKYIQEPVITLRNERFVIPVKEEYRGQVKGFIHDVSSKRFYNFY